MHIRSARAGGEALLRLAEGIEGLIVLVMNQMQIRRGEQRLLQPRTCRIRLPQFIDCPVKRVIVVGGPGHLAQQIEAVRVQFTAHIAEQG